MKHLNFGKLKIHNMQFGQGRLPIDSGKSDVLNLSFRCKACGIASGSTVNVPLEMEIYLKWTKFEEQIGNVSNPILSKTRDRKLFALATSSKKEITLMNMECSQSSSKGCFHLLLTLNQRQISTAIINICCYLRTRLRKLMSNNRSS